MSDAPVKPPRVSDAPASPVKELLSGLPIKWVVLALFVIVVIVLVLLRGAGSDTPSTGTPTPSLSPLPVVDCETIISSGQVRVAASRPVTVTLGDGSIPVVAGTLADEGWTYPSGRSGSGVWICGTVINYVVGLEPSDENGELLADLGPGDHITLHLANGTGFVFIYDETLQLDATDTAIYEQAEPRLTLLLEVEEGVVDVVAASYFDAAEPMDPSLVGDPVAVMSPVVIGEAQVTVLNAYPERDSLDLYPGTMYYIVDVRVENLGDQPIEASLFNMVLEDGSGVAYLLSPPASETGGLGPFGGPILPGGAVDGSAGYIVPEAMEGPTLLWTFSPWPAYGQAVQVSIPYSPEPATPGSVSVSLTDAFLSLDGDILIIVGEIDNSTSSVLTISASDVRLSSSAGPGNLRMAAPQLPWAIQPGQSRVIELQYDTPGATTALLTVLGFSFEIGGLPEAGGYGGLAP